MIRTGEDGNKQHDEDLDVLTMLWETKGED